MFRTRLLFILALVVGTAAANAFSSTARAGASSAAATPAQGKPPQAAPIDSDWPTNGRYATAQGMVYVGRTAEPPTKPQLEYFDVATHRIGNLVKVEGNRYRTQEKPYLDFDLRRPEVAVIEDRHAIGDRQGRFGFSLWHIRDATHRPLIVLLEGADDSTRDMGFLIPYFAANGLDVLTFDQRGTGISSGNWRFTGPADKAEDVEAALKSLVGDTAVDFARVGAWGPSNGGWVAPIIAHHYPLAFVILKSSSSGTIIDNVSYEVRQDLLHSGRFSPQQIDDAMRFERGLFRNLETNSDWASAGTALKKARTQPWFPLMRIPPGITTPPAPAMLTALRASLIYDPRSTLEHVTTPTLALYGALDRNVDVADGQRGFRAAFARSGMRDFTVHVFPRADHLLMLSKTGYESDALDPPRFVPGYPSIMIDWLSRLGLTARTTQAAPVEQTRSETK